MKALIINNLASGYRDGSIYDFVRSFTEDGDEVCMRSTDGTTSIDDLLDDASDFDVVVASGGDGTVTSVAYTLANTGVPLLPYPAGTANLLSLNLAQPNEPHALAKLARRCETLDFDVAEIEAEGEKHGFMIMAGGGPGPPIRGEGATKKRKIWSVADCFAPGVRLCASRQEHGGNLGGGLPPP